MVFEYFSKNYLNISMELFNNFCTIELVIFCLNLNKTQLTENLSGTPPSVKAGSYL